MTEQLLTQVAREIDTAERDGLELRSDFETLMDKTGHNNFSGLIRQGTACLDVEYGPEIFAFSSFKPKVFFATEPRQYGAREEITNLVLAEMTKKFPHVRLMRKLRMESLLEIKSKFDGEGLGMITWLNIFDDGLLGHDSFNNIIPLTGDYLVKNGLFVFSFVEDESSRREVFMSLAEEDFPGLRLQFAENSNSAGSIFLIGQKTA